MRFKLWRKQTIDLRGAHFFVSFGSLENGDAVRPVRPLEGVLMINFTQYPFL